ncbi:MAG TPA: trigger factor [Caulobacteraceae bacterium]
MQVTETLNESLSRSYSVRVPAAELGAMLEARIAEISPTLRLKGFRPGKVPAGHVRRLYGKALMGEVIEKTITETSQKVLDEHHLRVAAQPDLKPSSDMDEVLAGRQDLTYALDVEVMPDFEPADIAALSVQRLVHTPSEAEIDEAIGEVAKQNRTYAKRTGKAAKAETGDQLLIDFTGRIDGEAFEGGAAEDAEIVLGADQFIPGFEEQLAGAAPGKTLTVNVTFPEAYQVERLRGQAVEFKVKVKEVRAPKQAKADDALAVALGLSDLAALREAVRANLEGEFRGASRFKLKRALLDQLDARHDIPLPARMVEAEFDAIWAQVKADEEKSGRAPEDEGKSDETLRAEYRRISERRVRLGLVLAEIGRRRNVVISDQEMTEAMRAEARRYGEMAQRMFDFMRENPQAQASVRAPLYEEKVVDLIIGSAQITDLEVSRDKLFEEDELPEGISEPAPKKAAAKAKGVKTKTPVAAEVVEAATESVAPAPVASEPSAPEPVAKTSKPKTAKAKPAPESVAAPVAAEPVAKPKAAAKAAPKPKAAKPKA